jgi:hypothetical protein
MRSNLKAIRQHALLHFRLNPERLTEYISSQEERRAFPVHCTSGNASKPEMTPFGGKRAGPPESFKRYQSKNPKRLLKRNIAASSSERFAQKTRKEKWSEASQPSLHFIASSVD